MKVLYVSNDSGLGGAAISLIEMIGELSKYLEVGVVVREEGRVADELRSMGVPTYIVRFERDFMADYNPELEKALFVSNYNAACIVCEIAKKNSYDIIHTNSSTGNVGAIAALLAGIPHVWHIREFMKEHFDASYYYPDLKRQLIASSHVITISYSLKEVLLDKYGIESFFLYNGLDINKYYKEYKSGEKNRFLLSGDITVNKGQWDAVKAIEILKNRGIDNTELYIVGGGRERIKWELRKYIHKANIDDRIHIKDFNYNMEELRNSCGGVLVTSRMEALGRVTIEAMLSRKFVIGANTGGTRELIGDNERGILYQQGDANSLADAIEQYLNMREQLEDDILDRANAFACQNFDRREYARSLISLYKNVLGKNKLNDTDRQFLISEVKERFEALKGEDDIRSCTQRSDVYIRELKEKWEEIVTNNISVAGYFLDRNIRKICIYGMGYFGCRLYDSLEDSDVLVDYVIDRNEGNLKELCDVRTKDSIDCVDLVVVAVAGEERDIKNDLIHKTDCKILGISEIINSLFEKCGM